MRKEKSSEPIPPKELSDEQGGGQVASEQATAHSAKQSRRAPNRKRIARSRSLGAGLAVISGRVAGALSRRLHVGGGTSIVGVVAQRVYPNIVEHLATQLEYGSVIITGTNGKTTSSGFLAAILRDGGLRVWRNREGSNLMRGVASSLVIRALPDGQLRRSGKAISVLEVDEAALPGVVRVIPPRVLVITNLFRDQLDRYGEVDTVARYWREAISILPATSTLVLNADDPTVAHLGESFEGKVMYFGIDDPSLDSTVRQGESEHYQVIDTRACVKCGHEYDYDVRFYSHMGHYRCPRCGSARPQTDVSAGQVELNSFDRIHITVQAAEQQHTMTIPLPGLYNIYNALAAMTAALALKSAWEPIVTGIEQAKPAFGRGERVQIEGRTIRLLLAKNPAGFNEVLRTLFSDGTTRHVLFVLNDHLADGQDISWIWDVDFERSVGQYGTLAVAGTRALDLALRLKLAGVDQNAMAIIPPAPLRAERREEVGRTRDRTRAATTERPRTFGLKQALDTALRLTPPGETLFIVPTYTGLLEVHHELEQRGVAPRYWEEKES